LLLAGIACGGKAAPGEPKATPDGDGAVDAVADALSEGAGMPSDSAGGDVNDAPSDDSARDGGDGDGPDSLVRYFDLDDADAWSEFDLSIVAAKDGFLTARYDGATFDGRFIYFANEPYQHDEAVLRYDTQAEFATAASWQRFSVNALAGGDGCRGAIFAGGFVYLAPHHSNDATNTQVVRFAPEWFGTKIERFAVSALGSRGEFAGIVFDGRVLTFVPGGDEPYTRFTRYDTAMPFGDAASWSVSTDTSYAAGPQLGGFFDGARVYTSPLVASGLFPLMASATAVALDVGKSLTNVGAFALHDVKSSSSGAVFDGRFGYVPRLEGGSVLRFDVRREFSGVDGWMEYRIGGATSPPPTIMPSRPGSFDGRFVYFFDAAEVVRLDTRLDPAAAGSWAKRSLDAGDARWSVKGQVFDGEYLYFGGQGPVMRRFHVRTPKLAAPPNGGSFF